MTWYYFFFFMIYSFKEVPVSVNLSDIWQVSFNKGSTYRKILPTMVKGKAVPALN